MAALALHASEADALLACAAEEQDWAARAGLVHASDEEPGYRRRRCGSGFLYIGPGGAPERDPDALARFKSLAIPPAWTEVWICPDPLGHIQAVGRDAKGRKQYRYHPDWRAVRDEAKFHRMPWFGARLPDLRARIEADLAAKDREVRVLAAIAALLDRGALRVGSSYAYEGVGAATLKKRNVDVTGARVRLRFRGKSGKAQDVCVSDRRLAKVVRQLTTLPGQELFKTETAQGGLRPVTSHEVNDYLRALAGDYVTAKEFRTWAAGAAAVGALRDEAEAPTVKLALAAAAERLGNTPAVCRKSYVHPKVLECALARTRPPPADPIDGLSEAEASFLRLLA